MPTKREEGLLFLGSTKQRRPKNRKKNDKETWQKKKTKKKDDENTVILPIFYLCFVPYQPRWSKQVNHALKVFICQNFDEYF